jgi:hypothetical protein
VRKQVTALRRASTLLRTFPWRDGPPRELADTDSGPLQVIVDDHTQDRSRVRHGHKCLAYEILGLMALSAARRWSLGKTTTKGSLTRRRNAKSGSPRSLRRKAASTFPCKRAFASSGEVLTRHHHVDIGQFVAQDLQGSGDNVLHPFSRLNFQGFPLLATFLVKCFAMNSRKTPSAACPATPIAKLVKTRPAPLFAGG